MAKEQPTTADIERAAVLLEQIASACHALDRECYFRGGEPTEERDAEDLDRQIDRMRAEILRMGWMADLGCTLMQGPLGPVRGNAEKWLLPPAYHESQEASHG